MKNLKTMSLSLLVLTAVLFWPRIAVSQSAETISTFTVTRSVGAADKFSQMISVPDSLTGPYTLRLVNGDPATMENHGNSNGRSVASGTVSINGIEVVRQRELTKVSREIIKQVNLSPGVHTVEVTVDGRAGSFITVTITGVVPGGVPQITDKSGAGQ